ncbi:MmyB family transcriptional regulator [Cellulosimicrobium sp. Marseille-Q8652]
MPEPTTQPSLALPEREPAVVLDGGLLVVDANRRWRSLHLPLTFPHDLGRTVFCDPAAVWFFADRQHEEYDVVAALLDSLRDEHAHDSARAAVSDLRATSRRFADLWEGRRVRQRQLDTYAVRHPDLGDLTFDRRTVRRDGYLLRVATPRPATSRLLPLLDHLSG